MTRNQTFRPRISRDRRDRLLDVAEQLNGEEVSGTNEALGLVCNYLDVLQQAVESCPECGRDLAAGYDTDTGWLELPEGKWHCSQCGVLDVWDYMGTANRDDASLPGLPRSVKLRFECSHEHDQAGTNDRDSTQDTQSQTAGTSNSGEYWENGQLNL